jgi:hypothetical protein
MTLTGMSLRLSLSVARLGRSSAVVTRRHSVTDRGSAKVASLTVDGVHALGTTSLTLQNGTTADTLRGTIPEGLALTIDGNAYAAAADAEDNRANRIVVTITPGLVAEAADETAVTLGDSVVDTHPNVNLRPANQRDIDLGSAARAGVTLAAAFPGHLAPRWVHRGSEVVYTWPDGRTNEGRVADLETTTWGQRCYS